MGRLRVFRECILRYWCRILRRRSQRHRVTWQRMYQLATQWLPELARYDPRQEPGTVVPHAGICAGGWVTGIPTATFSFALSLAAC